MNHDEKIYVAGHSGLVGSAIMRALQKESYGSLLTRTLPELDLRNQADVMDFFAQERPAYVFLAAARVGGIKANRDYPASFIYDNLMIECNVIHAAHRFKVKKLLFLGSSCIYPRLANQPIHEEYLLSGGLEETNRAYAIAKIAGLELCASYRKQYGDNFISCMPTNLYGPGDTFHSEQSHVIPALMYKMYQARIHGQSRVCIWGTGTARREFLYVDDCAQALLFLMLHYNDAQHINIGTGSDISIAQLASMIKETMGYEGELFFDPRLPEGTPRKVLAVERIHKLGWRACTSLQDGLQKTSTWYQNYMQESNLQPLESEMSV